MNGTRFFVSVGGGAGRRELCRVSGLPQSLCALSGPARGAPRPAASQPIAARNAVEAPHEAAPEARPARRRRGLALSTTQRALLSNQAFFFC